MHIHVLREDCMASSRVSLGTDALPRKPARIYRSPSVQGLTEDVNRSMLLDRAVGKHAS